MNKIMHRIIAAASAAVIAIPTALSVCGSNAEVYDVNGDGVVDTRDLVRVMKNMAARESTDDINGDGRCDTRDLIALMKMIASGTNLDGITLKSELGYIAANKIYAVGDKDQYAFVGLEGYNGTAASHRIDGELMADIEMLAKIFVINCVREDGFATLSYGDKSVRLSEATGTVVSDGRSVAKIRTEAVGDRLFVSAEKLAAELGYDYEYDAENELTYFYSTKRVLTPANKEKLAERIESYRTVVMDTSDVESSQVGVGLYKKTPESERVVGIAYTTWHSDMSRWGTQTWGNPLYGPYRSDDEEVIRRHGEELAAAGVDFVFVDWSNNTTYHKEDENNPGMAVIEDATTKLFEIWKDIPNAPKICIFVGPGHAGRGSITSGDHQRKVDQVYNTYIKNTEYNDMYYYYNGKPLLICYGATPNLYTNNPSSLWNDNDANRFEIRWMSGYVSQQNHLMQDKANLLSRGFWSWEERGAQSYTVDSAGYVECVTISAATRQDGSGDNISIPAVGRENGATFKRAFQRADDLGARIALIVSWNEWLTGEQPSVEVSKDIEPSTVHGTFYLDLMTQQIKKFKGLS